MTKKQEIIMEADFRFEREWWMNANPTAFAARLRMMDGDQLRKTSRDLADAITILHNARMRRGRNNLDWWNRGTACLGYLSEKKAILRQEMHKRPSQERAVPDKQLEHQDRMERISQIRDLAVADPSAALIDLCNLLMEKRKP